MEPPKFQRKRKIHAYTFSQCKHLCSNKKEDIQRTLKPGRKQQGVCGKGTAGKDTGKMGVKQRAVKLPLTGSRRRQLYSEEDKKQRNYYKGFRNTTQGMKRRCSDLRK